MLEYGLLNWNWIRLDQLSFKMATTLALGPTLLGVLGYSTTVARRANNILVFLLPTHLLTL